MQKEIEIWKDVINYEGYYQVSNFGRLKSFDRHTRDSIGRNQFHKGKILKGEKTKFGYIQMQLTVNSERSRMKIHRMVAMAFIPNPKNYPQVNHKDGDKLNNKVSNLEWCTPSQNRDHAIKTGLAASPIGETNYNARLTNVDVLNILESFKLGVDSYSNYAERYGVCETHIRRIVIRESWKHLSV